MRILVYSGHWGVAGGGENHTAGIVSLLKDYYDVTVMLEPDKMQWTEKIPEFFGWNLSGVKIIPYDPNMVEAYDQFINVNHGMLLPPLARRNMVLCFFPQNRWNTNGYDTVLTNSFFTKQQIVERWKRNEADISVIYPPIDVTQFYSAEEKKKQIMTIGRFFEVPDGNNKNHLFMIDQFKKLEDPDLKFVIVGSVQHPEYYQRCLDAAASDPRIEIVSDIPRQALLDLYAESDIYWHATGYGNDLPSSKEHFGMVAVEAMASGTIPLVHNSGGMPETGAQTWDEPEQLLELTKEILGMAKQPRRKAGQEGQEMARRLFHPEQTRSKLVEAVERPIAIFRPTEPGFQGSTAQININPREIKVGMIGDAPNITTGFGVVSKMFGEGFLKAGFQVTQIGLQDSNHEPRTDKWRVWRPGHNPLTQEFVAEWLNRDQPNVLWLNYDAGNIASWLNLLASMKCATPVIAYFPIEGFPIPKGFIEMSRLIAKPVTYLKWGSDLLYQSSGLRVDYVPHGLDHAKFERFSEERRQKLKTDIGWQHRFVIGAFGRNKRTKQQPRIIETMAMFKREGLAQNMVLYMHCQPFEGHMMNGWNLPDIVDYNDVRDMVAFPPDNQFMQIQGIDYEEPRSIPEEILSRIDWSKPESDNQSRAMILSSYSMIERYNMCDLFISVSQAEGFNLPLGEAMACGVPVICIDDEGSQVEVTGGAARLVKPVEWDTWHIGTLLPIASKKSLANEIAAVMRDPALREKMSDDSLKSAARYKWQESSDKMNRIVKETFVKSKQ